MQKASSSFFRPAPTRGMLEIVAPFEPGGDLLGNRVIDPDGDAVAAARGHDLGGLVDGHW